MAKSPPPSLSVRGQMGAIVALGTALVDLAVLAAFHVIQPDVSPLAAPTSDYANGTAGTLYQMAVFVVGAGALGLAVALRPFALHGRAKFAWVLLVIFAAMKMLQAFFPIDPVGDGSASGAVHNLAGNVAFFALPLAAVRLGADVAWETDRNAPKYLGWLLASATILVLVSVPADLFGIAQRLYLVAAALWVAVTAVVLLRSRPLSLRT